MAKPADSRCCRCANRRSASSARSRHRCASPRRVVIGFRVRRPSAAQQARSTRKVKCMLQMYNIGIILQRAATLPDAGLKLASKSLDLVAIGRSSVDLYGEQIGGRLEDMGSFAKYVGGSPTNTAIGAARLGLKSALLTRVGADHMGRYIREQLAREGVEVSVGPYRPGAADRAGHPRHSRPRAVPADLLPRELRRHGARGRTTSIPALIAVGRCGADQRHAPLAPSRVRRRDRKRRRPRARRRRAKVVFDIDYRPVLWGLTGKDMGENRFVAACGALPTACRQVLPLCDLIVGTEEEIHILGRHHRHDRRAARDPRTDHGAVRYASSARHGCVAFPGEIPDDA